jgi:hypothetical protein
MLKHVTLDAETIRAALVGYEQQQQQIEMKMAELQRRISGGGRAPAAAGTQTDGAPRKRRKMSAAARKRISAAQKKRWADSKKSNGTKATPEKPAKTATRKRKLSAAGRKRIVEATKRRWAAVRAAKIAAGGMP